MRKWLGLVLVVLLLGCGHVADQTADDSGEGDGGDGDVAVADTSEASDDRLPWDAAAPRGSLAVVVAANWTDPVGSIATFDLAAPAGVRTALTVTDSSDAVAVSFGGRVYVINRFGVDTVQVIDPADGSVVANYSVGAGSNPQDMYVYRGSKAYITRLDAHNDALCDDDIVIVDPLSGAFLGGIDLKPYTADDGERLARATQMVAVDSTLYVLIQDLPANLMNPADQPGKIVAIDMATDAVTGSITLAGRNPSDITYSPVTKKIYVVDTGVFVNFAVDTSDPYGGIEVVDPVAMTSEGIVVDDADFGDYSMLVRLGPDRAYTVVGGMTVASFDYVNPAVIDAALYVSPGFFVPDVALDETGRLLVTERDPAAAGIVILDGVTGDSIVGPVGVGALPASITLTEVD